MYGATIGNLTVTLNGRTLLSRSGNQGNAWLKAQVNTFNFGLHKVGDKNFYDVFVSRYGVCLSLLELVTIFNWQWRVGLLCPILCCKSTTKSPQLLSRFWWRTSRSQNAIYWILYNNWLGFRFSLSCHLCRQTVPLSSLQTWISFSFISTSMKEILLTFLQVVFNATVGSSFTGDIAIDDVSVQPGFCPSGKQRYRYLWC